MSPICVRETWHPGEPQHDGVMEVLGHISHTTECRGCKWLIARGLPTPRSADLQGAECPCSDCRDGIMHTHGRL